MRACYDAKRNAGMMSILIQLLEGYLTTEDVNRTLQTSAKRVPLGWTPLHMLCDSRCPCPLAEEMRPWCVKLLLQAGADANVPCYSPSHSR